MAAIAVSTSTRPQLMRQILSPNDGAEGVPSATLLMAGSAPLQWRSPLVSMPSSVLRRAAPALRSLTRGLPRDGSLQRYTPPDASLPRSASPRGHLLEAIDVARRVALHGLDQHVAADRAGGGAAGHAVLDDDGAGIARIGDRPPADEQRVVAQMPGQRGLGDAHVALALGDALDLGSTGLAGEHQLGRQRLALAVDLQHAGRAGGHHLGHALAHQRDVLGVEAEARRHRPLA